MKKSNVFLSRLKNRFSEDWKDLCDTIKDDKKAFKLNRILSNNISVAVLVAVIDILFLLLFNYVINVCSNVPKMAKDMSNMSSYFGVGNLLLSVKLLGAYKFVRMLYMMFVIAIVILDALFVYNIRTSLSEKRFNLQQKGDSRWAELEEIKGQYLEIDEVETEYEGMPGFPISRYEDKLYLDTNMTNNLIIGITRSGKGETHVFPSIDTYSRASEKPSMIITDMKAELYKSNQKSKILQKRGYDVYFLNLQNPLESMGYNPLEIIIEQWEKGNYTFAEDLAQTFVWQIFDPESATGTEKFFSETGANMTAGLILCHIEDCLRMDSDINKKRRNAYDIKTKRFQELDEDFKNEIREQYNHFIVDPLLDPNVDAIPDDVAYHDTHEYRGMINMYSIINTYFELASIQMTDAKGTPTGENKLDMYFSNRPVGNRGKMKYMSTAVSGAKTKASIYSTMNTKLTIYTLETVAKMTAESSFNLLDIGFGEKPMAIFLGIPDADASKYQIATTFIKQVYTMLATQCWDGGTCKRPVKFVLDEFGNLPKIEGMESVITVCAGRNITFDLYIQSFAQVDEKYGQTAKTIRSNCGNTIFIRTLDPATTEEFSKLVGSETIVNIQRNGKKLGLHKTFTESNDDKPLISTVQLGRLLKGEDVVVRSMKVADNSGHDVYMAPIFNSQESGKRLKFRYEYLEDYFPTPKGISLADVITESRDGIKLKQRIWDYEQSFRFIAFDRQASTKSMRIGDLEDKVMVPIVNALKRVISNSGNRMYSNVMEIPLSVAEQLIESETDISILDIHTRNSVLSALNHYLEREEVDE